MAKNVRPGRLTQKAESASRNRVSEPALEAREAVRIDFPANEKRDCGKGALAPHLLQSVQNDVNAFVGSYTTEIPEAEKRGVTLRAR
jgi:hypothetical protein